MRIFRRRTIASLPHRDSGREAVQLGAERVPILQTLSSLSSRLSRRAIVSHNQSRKNWLAPAARWIAAVAGLTFAVICSAVEPALSGPALLVDTETGLVLYAEDADQPWHPASLTKLMTSYIVFEALRDGKLSPEDVLTCSERAHNEPPSKVGLPVGGQVKVDFAIRALIVKSANDIAIMLAEKIGGTEANFVQMMNATAKRLGMTNTKFVNPNGLPMLNPDGTEGPQAETSARDMAIITRMLIQEFPQYKDLFGLPFVKMGGKVLMSHNSLLNVYEGADGMKTGFICAAGYNVVATATRNGRRLMAVVLGESSGGARTLRAAALLEHGFQIYPWKAVFAPTLDTWPVATPENATAPDLHSVVCAKPVAKARRVKRPPLQPGHRKAGPPPRAKPRSNLKRTAA